MFGSLGSWCVAFMLSVLAAKAMRVNVCIPSGQSLETVWQGQQIQKNFVRSPSTLNQLQSSEGETCAARLAVTGERIRNLRVVFV